MIIALPLWGAHNSSNDNDNDNNNIKENKRNW